MLVQIKDKMFEYSQQAILNMLRDPDFVRGIVDGHVVIFEDLTYLQQETLFETMERDLDLVAA